jgi:hypothetical protein
VGYFEPQYAPRQFWMIAGGVTRYIRVNPERGTGYTPDTSYEVARHYHFAGVNFLKLLWPNQSSSGHPQFQHHVTSYYGGGLLNHRLDGPCVEWADNFAATIFVL